MARAGASRNQVVDVLTFKQDLTAGAAVNVHFYNWSHIKHVAGLGRADPLLSVSLSLLFLNSVPSKTLSRVPPSCFLSFLLFAGALGAPVHVDFPPPWHGRVCTRRPQSSRGGQSSIPSPLPARNKERTGSARGAQPGQNARSARLLQGSAGKQTPALVIRWPRRRLTFTAPFIFPPFLGFSFTSHPPTFLSFYICWLKRWS